MLFVKSLWVLSLLICYCWSFIVDDNSYLYLNTSYSRQTISFSLNIRVHQSTQIKIVSPILIPHGEHIMIGSLQQNKTISFDNAFDSDLILYNSYEGGQHWFGVKIKYLNPNNYDFATIQLHLQRPNNKKSYVFMAPLFTLPLNAIEVWPKNTLYTCHQYVLLSYLYSHSEIDFYAIGRNQFTKGFKVNEKKDWGFYRQDVTVNYLRQKSKSKLGSGLTFSYLKANGNSYQCKIDHQSASNQKQFQSQLEGATLEQLLRTAIQLNPQSSKAEPQL